MTKHPYFQRKHSILILAHRGERGHAPENTMVAFQRAADLDVDSLETDIHRTADGVIVAFHDDTLERTTNGHGRIQDFTFAQLQELDAGYNWTADHGQTFPYRDKGITIPSLTELFETFADFRINIDIKQESPSIVADFATLIKKHGREQTVCVGSFDDDNINQFRKLLPHVPTAAGYSETRRAVILDKLWLGRFFNASANAFQVPEAQGGIRVVTPSFIQMAHRRGMEVHVWTVNETADMERLIEWGVDGLVTDYPARLLSLL